MNPHNTRDKFRRLLKADNIDAIFRINPVGRIYGVTFIDHKAGVVANGSVLGKEFSANRLQRIVSGTERGAAGCRTTIGTETTKSNTIPPIPFLEVVEYGIGFGRHEGL